MTIAILILTIINLLILLIVIAGLAVLHDDIKDAEEKIIGQTNESIEAATTAVFNMESIKQKVDMTGRFDV